VFEASGAEIEGSKFASEGSKFASEASKFAPSCDQVRSLMRSSTTVVVSKSPDRRDQVCSAWLGRADPNRSDLGIVASISRRGEIGTEAAWHPESGPHATMRSHRRSQVAVPFIPSHQSLRPSRERAN
jgi:hypothetical protein